MFTMLAPIYERDQRRQRKQPHSWKGELGYWGSAEVMQKAREWEEQGRKHDLEQAAPPVFVSFDPEASGIVAAMRSGESGKSLATSLGTKQ